MAKVTLDIEYDYDFKLIGISCHARDYRLCWFINNQLGMDFSRQENIKINTRSSNAEFALFTWDDEDRHQYYSLISNKGTANLLIPEHKQADFFIKIDGNVNKSQMNNFMAKLKEIEIILTAYPIEINNLKSKQNLLIE